MVSHLSAAPDEVYRPVFKILLISGNSETVIITAGCQSGGLP